MDVYCEPATPADAEVLMQIHADAFAQDQLDYGQGPAGHHNLSWHHWAIEHHRYFKMLVAGEIVGGMVVEDKGEGHYFLNTLFIASTMQGHGYGQKAMGFLEQAFPGAKRWSLFTPHKSYRNHQFYEKLGYQKVGEKFLGDQAGLVDDFTLFIYEKQR